uniref:Uncharacterized protein n=1 Tax=Vespula pensylvanica TaxID=30213 RepID=A0A834N341_VESPE|nr:hypothetical protein H0235_017477 [Vespula pensylvanica]
MTTNQSAWSVVCTPGAQIKILLSIQHISVRATDYTVLSTEPISRTRKVDAKFAKKETVSISRKDLQLNDLLLKICKAWLMDNLPDTDENLEVPTMFCASHRDLTERHS